MITFHRFGKHGRLGNQLFQLASMIAFSKKYNQELFLPAWTYRKFFQRTEHWKDKLIKVAPQLKEVDYHYVPEFWDPLAKGDWDIHAWLQTEKHWEAYRDIIKDALTWEKGFEASVIRSGPKIDWSQAIAISVRRGDYVKNENYDQLPISYYMQALMQEFPDWMDRPILIFSDDIEYCRIHFAGLPNVWFARGTGRNGELDAIVQLCMMSQCNGFILANSTFSWWGAYLAELRNPDVKIVRPKYLFAGPLLEKSDAKDHWPERWTVYDHKEADGSFKKYDLSDVTFTIPVMYDHQDRKQNVDLNVCLLQRVFNTSIVIGERTEPGSGIDGCKFMYMGQFCYYMAFQLPNFHRTWMLNRLAHLAHTPIIANWDADVSVPEVQVMVAVEMIRKDRMDGAYPFDGRFARVPRNPYFKILEKELDLGTVFKGVASTFKGGQGLTGSNSVGGAVFWNRKKFFEGGGENELFISHAPEDAERWERMKFLGYRVGRIIGHLFHMDHWVGPNSSGEHPDMPENRRILAEFRAIIAAGDVEKMWEYVKAWPWYITPEALDDPERWYKTPDIRDVEWNKMKEAVEDGFKGFEDDADSPI